MIKLVDQNKTFKLSHRPFPLKKPVTYYCTAANLHQVTNQGITKNAWLDVIATTFLDEDTDDIAVSFYGLIKTNGMVTNSGNYGLHNTGDTNELFISVNNRSTPTRFLFASIDTIPVNDSLHNQLDRYCTPSPLTEWDQLPTTGENHLWCLTLPDTSSWLQGFTPPNITFSFPSFTTIENIVRLEEMSETRHRCTIIPCNEFLICPSTIEEPTPTVPTHGHCISELCVRYFEMTTMPPNPTFVTTNE
jgi:hypothetical protein